jgi:Flp pilus assembly protein TadD
MPRLPVAFALMVASAAAAGKDPWIRVTSPHFEVLTDAGAKSGREVTRHFEQVHGFFFERFKTGIDPDRKARVIVCRNSKEYAQYRPNEFSAAFYHPGEFHDFILLDRSVDEWRPTAVHELTHLMVRQLGAELPLWLNEGLAELYSNMEPRGDQVMVGRDIPGRLQLLASEEWIGLPALLAVNHQSPIYNRKSHAGIFYAESWKLVHMLHLNPGYASKFTEFLRAVLRGEGAGAFQSAFGKDVAAVERDLRSYLSGNTISALLFNIRMPKSIDAIEVEEGASLHSRLALAELLSNSRGQGAKAADAYQRIARDFPNRWEVEESQALFAWHERRMDEAERHFAKAEELGCVNGAAYLLWGRALVYTNRTRDAVRVLGKAVKLVPDSSDAALAYGDALIRNGSYAAAVAALREVKAVPATSAWRYRYNLAYGFYKLGDVAAAKTQLASARQHAASAREKESLDQLEAALRKMPGW